MKFLNKKRIASSVLASALALSMATPAFATAAPNTTTIAGTYNAIKLAVTVPTTGKAIINPYGLPFKLGDSTISGQQITTAAPLTIQNKSAVALSVKAKVTGTASQSVTLEANDGSTDLTDGDSGATTKTLRVQFQAFAAPELTVDTLADTAALNEAFAALKDADADLTADVLVPDAQNNVTAQDAAGTLVLREGDEEGALQPGGAAFFRLSGEAAMKADWQTTDTFGATIAFTFTPGAYVGNGGTLAAAGNATQVTEGADLAITLTLPAGVRPVVDTIQFKTNDTNGTNLTVANDGSTATAVKGKVTGVSPVSTAKKVWVEFTGTDGVNYKSNELSLKVVAA